MNAKYTIISIFLIILILALSSNALGIDNYLTSCDWGELEANPFGCCLSLVEESSDNLEQCTLYSACNSEGYLDTIPLTKYYINNNEYFDLVSSYSTTNYSFVDAIPENTLCPDTGLLPCDSFGLIENTPPCLCGFQELDGTEGNYCCVDTYSNIFINETPILNCNEQQTPADTYAVTGSIQIVGAISPQVLLSQYSVVISGSNNANTNPDGLGDFSFLLEDGNYSVGVSMSNQEFICSAAPQSFAVEGVAIGLGTIDVSCEEVTSSDCNSNGYECCVDEDVLGNEYDFDCAEGYTCTDQCFSGTCNPGQCYTAQNSYCNSSAQLEEYNLNDVDDFNIYCSQDLCLDYDSDCNQVVCQSDYSCNGICQPGCSDLEDPDCGSGYCDLENNLWCDTNGNWIDNSNGVYCSHCPQDEYSCDASCGNGVIDDPIESCDYGDGLGGWEEGLGEDGCSDVNLCGSPDSNYACECLPIAPDCDNGLIDPGEICQPDNNNIDCPLGYECNDCFCEQINPECSESFDSINAFHVPCSNNMIIEFIVDIDCISDIDEFMISSCNNEACEFSSDLATISPEQSVISYSYNYQVDLFNENYWFIVEAMIDGESFFSEIVHFESGDIDCMFPAPVFGGNDCVVGTCSGGNKVNCSVENEFNSGLCESPSSCSWIDGVPECNNYDIDVCDQCAGITGMFYNPTLLIETDTTSQLCENYFYGGSKECFIDPSFTVIDEIKSCSEVSSCYSYNSEENCQLDVCSITEDENCEWIPYNIQTGRGVCRPQDSSLYECSNALNFNLNSLFLYDDSHNDIDIATSKRTCEMFGDCYYQFIIDSSNTYGWSDPRNDCLNNRDLICSDFITEEDCLGDSMSNFLIDKDNFQVINYSNNSLSDRSKCKWEERGNDGFACIRDANDDMKSDSLIYHPEFPVFASEEINNVFHSNIPAQRDFENPITIINVDQLPLENIFGENVAIPFSVQDNLYAGESISTYYCVNKIDNALPSGFDAYNVSSLPDNCSLECEGEECNWHKAEGYSFTPELLEEGPYSLYFFSMDNSLNLEHVQGIYFESDFTKPAIDLNYYYETDPIPTEYINTLYLNFTVDPNSQCLAYLILAGYDGFENRVNAEEDIDPFVNGTGTEFQTIYPGLIDGMYNYNIVCTDTILGNTESSVTQIQIQGDTRIFDVTPRYEWTTESMIDFELKTANTATCYYSSTNTSYSDMVEEYQSQGFNDVNLGQFESTLNNIHSVDDILLSEDSAVYKINVACEIEVINPDTGELENQTVEGNSMHRIIFSEDYESPFVYIKIKDTNDDVYGELTASYARWYEEPTLNISCEDALNFGFGNNFVVDGIPLVSGCDAATFIYGTDFVSDTVNPVANCNPISFANSNSIEVLIEDPDIYPINNEGYFVTICAEVFDVAGNIKEDMNWDFTLDGVAPIPTFEITQDTLPITELRTGTYTIDVYSDENLSNYQELAFTTLTEPEQYLTLLKVNNLHYDASIRPGGISSLINYEGDIIFRLKITDAHGRFTEEDYTYQVDTRIPDVPLLYPILNFQQTQTDGFFEDLFGDRYPVYYALENSQQEHLFHENLSDTYYINDLNLFISGFVSGDLNLKLKIKESELLYQTIDSYNQSMHVSLNEETNEYYYPLYLVTSEDYNIVSYNKKGSDKIYLYSHLSTNFIGYYAKLPYVTYSQDEYGSYAEGKHTIYGNYSKYYTIVNFSLDNINEDDVTILTLDSPLEFDVLTGIEESLIYLYSNSSSENIAEDYFELNLNNTKEYSYVCPEYYENQYLLKVEAFESSGFSSQFGPLIIFIDDVPPELDDHDIPQGTYNKAVPNISLSLSENRCGSGLNIDKAHMLFYNTTSGVLYRDVCLDCVETFTYIISDDGDDIIYEFNYYPEGNNFSDGDYELYIDFVDYAVNTFLGDTHYFFRIDTEAPTEPSITVEGSNTNYNPFSAVPSNTIYATSSDHINITLDFEDDVNITANLSRNGIVFDLDCYNDVLAIDINKTFICVDSEQTIPEGFYTLSIFAYKLNDTNIDHPGTWNHTMINIDRTAPLFTPQYSPYINPIDNFRLDSLLDEGVDEVSLLMIVGSGEIIDEYEASIDPSDSDIFYRLLSPSNFGWTDNDAVYYFNMTLFDRAMNNATVSNLNVTIDSIPPEIEITDISSDPYLDFTDEWSLLNISTSNHTDITISGNTSLDTEEICYTVPVREETICQGRCSISSPPCIGDGGDFSFSFSLGSDDVDWGNAQEFLNEIYVDVTDFAQNSNNYDLSILLDLKPPVLEEEPVFG